MSEAEDLKIGAMVLLPIANPQGGAGTSVSVAKGMALRLRKYCAVQCLILMGVLSVCGRR